MADTVQSSSKRPCVSGEEKLENLNIDRISELPDEVLCHILSFLPTKDSVSTTILSKRWESLWIQVLALNFYLCYNPISYKKSSWLLNFVNNVCSKSKAKSIRNFTLRFRNFHPGIDEQVLKGCIGRAVRLGVEELSLEFDRFSRPAVNYLLGCLFDCKTLVSLELKGGIFVDVPATVHLPCLKILQLKEVIYANDESLRRLFSGCPVLEDLTIERNRLFGDNIIVLDINVPSLKRITVKRYSYPDGQTDGKLLITAPMLERLDDLMDPIFWDKSPNDYDLLKLLKQIANVRFLSLFWPNRWSSKATIPVLHNLVHLDIGCSHRQWHSLLALLECSDNLKTLEFRCMPPRVAGDRCDRKLKRSVPKCVSMSLKTLIFRRFCNQKCELEPLRYVLKNAKFLEQVKIFGVCLINNPSCENPNRKDLLKCPRASVACDISFFIEEPLLV